MEDFKIKFIREVSDAFHFNFHFPCDVADFIACQFALESSFGRSKLALVNQNYCGMKLPLVRFTLAINYGSEDKWAKYHFLFDCISDFVLCLQYRKPILSNWDTIPHYCDFIKDWYCPEKDYIHKIQSIYYQFKSLQNGN